MFASIQSPLAAVYMALHGAMGVSNESMDLIGDEQRDAVLRGVFDNFYQTYMGVVFDNSRAWSSRIHELFRLLPKAKMICMVRPVNEILDSFERVYRVNPMKSSTIFPPGTNTTQRINAAMAPGGVVQASYANTKDAFYSPYRDRLLFVRYDTLVNEPMKTIGAITKFATGKEWTAIDPQMILPVSLTAEFDRRLGVDGLHELRPSIRGRAPEILIPPEQWNAHANSEFWGTPDLNTCGMTVL